MLRLRIDNCHMRAGSAAICARGIDQKAGAMHEFFAWLAQAAPALLPPS
jgi:hypothetical protein